MVRGVWLMTIPLGSVVIRGGGGGGIGVGGLDILINLVEGTWAHNLSGYSFPRDEGFEASSSTREFFQHATRAWKIRRVSEGTRDAVLFGLGTRDTGYPRNRDAGFEIREMRLAMEKPSIF